MEVNIHRDSEVARLTSVLKSSAEKIAICGVSGTGGIGKTYLVDHVLESIDLEHSGFLKLSADGMSNQLRGDFVGLLDQKIALRTLHRPAKPEKDYFPAIREIADAHAALLAEVEEEVSTSNESSSFKTITTALIKGGQILNKTVPKSKGFLNFSALPMKPKEVDSAVDEVWDKTRKLRSLAVQEPNYLPRVFRNMVGMTLRNRIRRDLYGVAADYLFGDLCKIVGVQQQDNGGWRKARAYEFSKLLLVLDDFEVLGPTLSEFVFNALMPKLQNADFESVILIVGRDDFKASNPDWHYRYQRYVRDQIRLAPFSEGQALEFLSAFGITGEEAQSIYKYSEGFPFLLSLMAEERGISGNGEKEVGTGGADVPRQFFDRTTRWMSDREIEWFTTIVYLDKVNFDTLSWFFPQEDIEKIQYWFEREGSIRDPRAKFFRVKNVIREKVLQYLSIRSPSQHRKTLDTVKARLRDEEPTPVSS